MNLSGDSPSPKAPVPHHPASTDAAETSTSQPAAGTTDLLSDDDTFFEASYQSADDTDKSKDTAETAPIVQQAPQVQQIPQVQDAPQVQTAQKSDSQPSTPVGTTSTNDEPAQGFPFSFED